MSRNSVFMVVLAGLLAIPTVALTQDARRGRDQRGRPGDFDPARMRERQLDNIKDQLDATDEEWETLAPKIEAVMTAQSELRGGPGGGMRPGRPGGPAPAGSDDQAAPGRPRDADTSSQSKVAAAERELRTVLEDEEATKEDIAAKLAAYRKAREAARSELQTAQRALKELVSGRQEAVLVLMGMLE
ncbi:MAG TPA: hypothetical protein PKK06_02745 [Phycisphaerae bacterium]|nr:hypothetical protein [Phycisphaerae bacterium]HNU44604.1 hypothetical protein [Phycisphaerae bacterium]